jgi:hypothetical protein
MLTPGPNGNREAYYFLFDDTRIMTRIIMPMKRAILPITAKRIPAIISSADMAGKRSVFGDRLPSRNNRPIIKAATINSMTGNNFTPLV